MSVDSGTVLDPVALRHAALTRSALADADEVLGTAAAWGRRLATLLSAGQRLLVAGNGGSAAEAQHLTAELVGRYRAERRGFSALALHAETSSLTAIGNDYGWDESFARQVAAHGRPGDVLLLLSTSGRSANVIRAAERARDCGVTSWALTGPAPNPLADHVDWPACVAGATTAAVQEVHLVAAHVLCEAFDDELADREAGGVS